MVGVVVGIVWALEGGTGFRANPCSVTPAGFCICRCENHFRGAGEDEMGALSGPNGADTQGVPSDPQEGSDTR